MNSKGEKDEAAKGDGEGDPSRGGLQGAFEIDRAWVAMKKNQIRSQQNENERTESQPPQMKVLMIHLPLVAGPVGQAKEESVRA